MHRLGKCMLVTVLAAVPATALGASGSGTWRPLRPAPFAVPQGSAAVWTGKQLIVFGRSTTRTADAAEVYSPVGNTWKTLTPPAGPATSPGYKAVWTGKEMLVFGAVHSVAYNAAHGTWRVLRGAVPAGITLWTGREAIGWGGGCCGDAFADGAAYDPATDSLRKLPRSPLAPSQRPLGVWTGRKLLLFVSGFGPDGKRLPARLARAAAYDPSTNKWQRIAALPESGVRFAGLAAWDGHEVLVVGAGEQSRSALAYNPATNRWRRLASLPASRVGAAALWTGNRLLLWGGESANSNALRDGLAYDPSANRWTSIPKAPFHGRTNSTVVWTGGSLLVWGGVIGTPVGTNTPPVFPRDGAVYVP